MNSSRRVVVTFSLVMAGSVVLAQGAPPATPIDGGLFALLAAGGIYGIKKLKDSYRK